MIKYRFNPNASGMPRMETAEVHGAEFALWLNSGPDNIGEIDDDMIPMELLKEFERHGYIELLSEDETA